MANNLWILKGDSLEKETTVSYFFFDKKLMLGSDRKIALGQNIWTRLEDVMEAVFYDFFVEVTWKGFNFNPIADSVIKELALPLRWGARLPNTKYVSQEEFSEIRNRMRFDRKWNVKLG